MRKTEQSPNGTSFHDSVIVATVAQLRKVIGEPDRESNDGQDKVNFDWVAETENGGVFTVYDWKEYRRLSEEEEIEWHIGGHSRAVTEKAVEELEEELIDLEMDQKYPPK